MCAIQARWTCLNMEVQINDFSDIARVLSSFKEENKQILRDLSERVKGLEESTNKKKPRKFNFCERASVSARSSEDSAESQEETSYLTPQRRDKRARKTGRASTGVSQVRAINPSGFAAIQSDDLQSEYQQIRESVSRHRLPKDLKFSGSSRGLKSQVREAARLLSISGKFLETSIRITSNIQSGLSVPRSDYDPLSDVEDLLITLIAHMRTIQEEFCLLSVQSNYGTRTQQIFRSIHTNPAQFTPTVIEELRTSATLAAIPPEVNTDRGSQFNTYGRGGGGFRGSFRGGFRGRGQRGGFNQQNQQEGYPGFRPRYIPNERPQNNNSEEV